MASPDPSKAATSRVRTGRSGFSRAAALRPRLVSGRTPTGACLFLRRHLILAAVGTAVGLCGAAPAAAAQKCTAPHSVTLLRTADLRVYRTPHGDVLGCHRRATRRVVLAYRENDDIHETVIRPRVRHRGNRVALVVYWDDGASYGVTVKIADLRHAHVVEYTAEPEDSPVDTFVGVSDLELLGNGAFAWITTGAEHYGRPGRTCSDEDTGDTCQVHAVTSTGKRLLLDTAPDIRLFSLRATPSGIEWQHGSERRSAVLRG